MAPVVPWPAVATFRAKGIGVCMYVCIYMFQHVYVHVYTYIYMYIELYIYIYTHTFDSYRGRVYLDYRYTSICQLMHAQDVFFMCLYICIIICVCVRVMVSAANAGI